MLILSGSSFTVILCRRYMYLKCISEAQTLQGKKLTTEVGMGFVNFSGYLIKLLSGDGDRSRRGGGHPYEGKYGCAGLGIRYFRGQFLPGIRFLAIFYKISNFGTL